jgi:hypothetical protein
MGWRMSRIAIVISFERTTRDGVPIEEIKVDSSGDATTHDHYQPPGEDSPPLPGDYAVLVESDDGAGEEKIVGYSDPVNEGVAEPGERRQYARDADGNVVVSIHMKADGSLEISNENGSLTLEVDGSVSASGDLSVAGDLTVGGSVIADGSVTAGADVVAGNAVPASAVHLLTHVHPTAGTGAPSPPTPGT